MIEGFWIIQYEGIKDNGGGVVMLIRGHVFGGDCGYTYIGSYQTQDNAVKAKVMVRNFLPNVQSVLGVTGDFELLIEGRLEANVIRGTGTLARGQAAGVALKLTKRADLPV